MQTFQELLLALAARPETVGIRDASGFLSYAALAARALDTAQALQQAWPANSRFLLPAWPNADFVANWLALMAAGMLAIPCAPELPESRLAELIDRFRARLFTPIRGQSLLPLQPLPQDVPCLALLTSGSTGELKAAAFRAAAVLWNARSVMANQALEAPGRVGIQLPLHHAFGLITQLLPALLSHSPVWLFRRGLLPGDLLMALRQEQIETFAAVPTTLRWMLQGNPPPLPALRHLSVAGAALHPAEYPALQALMPAAQIWIGYGLTEAGPRVSAISSQQARFQEGSAGYPLTGVSLKVVDGEIWVSSPSVMAGYLDAPELSAATLQERWLRTGDCGELQADHLLFIHGRKDDILLCGGEKVAPLRIESVLAQLPEVLQAAVYGEADTLLGTRPVALIQLQPGQHPPSLHNLRRFCRQTLEAHEIPTAFYRVQDLPLTPNGKLLRKELPTWPKQSWS